MLRKINKIELPPRLNKLDVVQMELEPGHDDDGAPEPTIEWVDPLELWVDEEAYQRVIGKTGMALIRRVAWGSFSWRKFKLPVVTRRLVHGVSRLVVIDGQHTATMAATRGITRIPVFCVTTFGTEDEADAFYGQNMNRTAISGMQAHKALVAAGDEKALTVSRVFDAAGVKLLMFKNGEFKPSETLALGTVRTLVNRRGENGAIRVMRICADANLAPIMADHFKAVEALIFESEFAGTVRDDRLADALMGSAGIQVMQEAAIFAARHRVPMWKGLTTVLYQAATKRRVAA